LLQRNSARQPAAIGVEAFGFGKYPTPEHPAAWTTPRSFGCSDFSSTARHRQSSWSLARKQRGFSLLEMLFSLLVLSIVIAIIMTGMAQMMNTQGTIGNRTEMHRNVRSATELLQQEVGQAGRITLPGTVTLSAAATASASAETVAVSSTAGMYSGMYVDVLPDTATSANYEIIQLTGVTSTTITASSFAFAHISGAQLTVSGSIGTGVIPPAALTYVTPNCPASTVSPTTYTAYTNGSTCNTLKLYGDINGNGSFVYVEYACVPGTSTSPGYLYRNEVTSPLTAASKPAVSASVVLLNNLLANPGGAPCFSYQTAVGASGNTYVLNVAITLSVQTQQVDPQTGLLQNETKALLNVSSRNVFDSWELDSAQAHSMERVQPMPSNITANLLSP
jgi:prepilin-type N-terminal cleavage/methylation domain-containing protein